MTRPELYLIDGYNVIRRDPQLREVEQRQGLEAGRVALITRMKASSLIASTRTTIVFDGSGAVASSASSGHANLRIVFSVPPANADATIVAMVRGHQTPDRVVVVTSDQELSWDARQAGAAVVSTENFKAMRRPPGGKRKRHQRPRDGAEKPLPTGAEVAWGLSVFGDETDDETP